MHTICSTCSMWTHMLIIMHLALLVDQLSTYSGMSAPLISKSSSHCPPCSPDEFLPTIYPYCSHLTKRTTTGPGVSTGIWWWCHVIDDSVPSMTWQWWQHLQCNCTHIATSTTSGHPTTQHHGSLVAPWGQCWCMHNHTTPCHVGHDNDMWTMYAVCTLHLPCLLTPHTVSTPPQPWCKEDKGMTHLTPLLACLQPWHLTLSYPITTLLFATSPTLSFAHFPLVLPTCTTLSLPSTTL